MASLSTRGAAALVLLFVVIAGTTSMVAGDCSGGIGALSPCFPSVTKGGSPPSSGSPCCTVLRSWGIDCLCNTVSQYKDSLPSSVDVKSILALPKQCDVDVPVNYSCAGEPIPS